MTVRIRPRTSWTGGAGCDGARRRSRVAGTVHGVEETGAICAENKVARVYCQICKMTKQNKEFRAKDVNRRMCADVRIKLEK